MRGKIGIDWKRKAILNRQSRHRMYAKRPPEIKKCFVCRNRFECFSSGERRAKAYCSMVCNDLFRQAKRTNNMLEKRPERQCTVCGVSFKPKGKSGKRITCSAICQRESWRRFQRKGSPKYKLIEKIKRIIDPIWVERERANTRRYRSAEYQIDLILKRIAAVEVEAGTVIQLGEVNGYVKQTNSHDARPAGRCLANQTRPSRREDHQRNRSHFDSQRQSRARQRDDRNARQTTRQRVRSGSSPRE
jgi:hypothetical protein